MLAVFAAVCVGSGCGLVRTYRCTSPAEHEAFNRAARNIYPDDVRVTPEGYTTRSLVAWAGIIIESERAEGEQDVVIDLVIEHHHFDWLEDFKLGDNIFVLSPKGEGRFSARWILSTSYGLEAIRDWTAPKNMVIVYGKPVGVSSGIIELAPAHIRFIPKRRYKFSEFPYGRHAGYHY